MDGGSGTGTGDARGADGGDARAGNPRAGMPVVTGRGMTALRRKFGGDEMSDSRGITRARLLTRFVGDLSSKKFGAIIFGYEGVLRDYGGGHTMPLKEIGAELERIMRGGIIVGIASRSGHESMAAELRHMIRPEHWDDTCVGYCNGTDIRALSDAETSQTRASNDHVEFVTNAIESSDMISESDVTYCGGQASIKNSGGAGAKKYSADMILRAMADAGATMRRNVKVFESDGYIDVVPYGDSRYEVVRRTKLAIPGDRYILCIGCRGQWPGADCELLAHRYSLSTGTVSATASSCWNLLPEGEGGEQGALTYMRSMRVGDGSGQGGWFTMRM